MSRAADPPRTCFKSLCGREMNEQGRRACATVKAPQPACARTHCECNVELRGENCSRAYMQYQLRALINAVASTNMMNKSSCVRACAFACITVPYSVIYRICVTVSMTDTLHGDFRMYWIKPQLLVEFWARSASISISLARAVNVITLSPLP